MSDPSTIWIVHRDPHQRAALSRIAASRDNTLLGGPGDEHFESSGAADLVVLGLSGDLESELEFVHRVSPRQPHCAWILLTEGGSDVEARRLFDTVDARTLPFPPSPTALRRAMRVALGRRGVAPLSRRRGREVLAARFARWFADLEFPDLLRALDPQLSSEPLLIFGEPGTGRGLIARYVHTFGGTPTNQFIALTCEGVRGPDDLLSQIGDAAARASAMGWTLWLDEVERLPLSLQRTVQDWAEFGLPEGAPQSPSIRWMASTGDPDLALEGGLDARLLHSLSSLSLRIPPLRERRECIEPFVRDTTLVWCSERGSRIRQFSGEAMDVLRSHPWPGNTRELEAVVIRSLAFSSADPIPALHLRFEAEGVPQRVEPEVVAEALDVDAAPTEVIATLEPEPEPEPEAELEPEAEPLMEVERIEPDASEAPVGLAAAAPPADESWRRLVGAVAHEVRNPLVSIRTFAELLPEHHDDEEFRVRFSELVSEDVRRIEQVVDRLQHLADSREADRKPVDVTAMLESLLEQQRATIQERRLLVLKELDRNKPFALVDETQLRDALDGLVSKSLILVPERGDVYLASRYNEATERGEATLRILLRYHGEPASGAVEAGDAVSSQGTTLADTALEFAAAEAGVRAQGGTLTVDASAQGTVVVIDLPAPR